MAFDPKQTARVAATDYIAANGYAAYAMKCKEAAVVNIRDADDDDCLRLCKALGYGQMFASARANGVTPRPKKTTATAINDLAAEIYGGPLNGEDDDAAEMELNPHRPIQPDDLPGDNSPLDPAKIYEGYNRLSPSVKAMRAKKLSTPDA